MRFLGNYVMQNGTYTDKEGYTHLKCVCTIPAIAAMNLGVFFGGQEDRTVSIYYDDAEEKIIIEKKK